MARMRWCHLHVHWAGDGVADWRTTIVQLLLLVLLHAGSTGLSQVIRLLGLPVCLAAADPDLSAAVAHGLHEVVSCWKATAWSWSG